MSNDALGRLAPHFFQVAYVIRDLEAAEKWFQRIMGVPFFTRSEIVLGEGCTYRGKPADSAMRLSLGFAGEVQIELIEALRGQSIYTEFMEAKGPGLHHVAFSVPDVDATVAELCAAGLVPIQEGSFGDGRVKFSYFDCDAEGASVIEILGFDAATTAAMEQMKQAAKAAAQAS